MPVSGGSGKKGIHYHEEVAIKCIVAGHGHMHSVLTTDMQERVLHTRARAHRLVNQIGSIPQARDGQGGVRLLLDTWKKSSPGWAAAPQTKHSFSKSLATIITDKSARPLPSNTTENKLEEERWTECGKYIHAAKGEGGPTMFHLCAHFPKQKVK